MPPPAHLDDAASDDVGVPGQHKFERRGPPGERALLEDVDLSGCVLTLDALHAARDTARSIAETHGADYALSVKANCPDTFAQLAAMDGEGDAVRRHADEPVEAHGRIEARPIAAHDLLPKTLAPFPEARQAFRIVRERTDAKTGETSADHGIASVAADRAEPERLLAWNRGHWQVENGNHATPAWARTPRASAPATPRPTTRRSTTSRSPWSSTTASATCPRPTATT